MSVVVAVAQRGSTLKYIHTYIHTHTLTHTHTHTHTHKEYLAMVLG